MARKKLEKSLNEAEKSTLQELEARCELEQDVHDLQESNRLLKEKVANLLATPPQVRHYNRNI